MKIYNTLNHKVETFVSHDPKQVKMYTCGPTVYNYAHIGNLRTYIFEDVFEKTLRYLGYDVKRCMNITDVGHMTSDADSGEDKILKASDREHKAVQDLVAFYTEAFKTDCAKLNIKWPEIVSKATDNIDEYIKIISKLLATGYAYASGGNIYYDITKAKNYYQLSGKNEAELQLAVRQEVALDDQKHNPFDFGLWFTNSKFINPILTWDSPFGRGYPGWHIECSGIAIKYLGEYLDIHCGGVDNIFPHHSNEIAQSEGYLGHKWCNYWVHGEFLNDETGKMSKSKGEFLTLSLLISKGYDPLSYRYFCLQSHYRKPLVFSYHNMDLATQSYNKLKTRIKGLNGALNEPIEPDLMTKYDDQFKASLSNDLNTASALTILYDVIKAKDLNDQSKLALITKFDQVLALSLLTSDKVDDDLVNYANDMVLKRKAAKANHDYALADQIRATLESKGITLKDTKDGTLIEYKKV